MIVKLPWTTFSKIKTGRWLIYELIDGSVAKVANVTIGPEWANPNIIFQVTPPISLVTFLTRFPEAIEVISMADFDGTSPNVITEPTPNATAFVVQVTTVAVAGTPVNLASVVVPDGRALVIASDLNNDVKKVVYVATSSANALSDATRITLSPGNSVKLFVNNTDKVWVDSNLSGQKVVAIVEQ